MADYKWTKWDFFWNIAMTILCIVCFPANPLVFCGIITTDSYPVLFIIGWIIWVIGMVLVMAPIIMFPRRGGVPRGKPFIHTTRLVDTGIYAVVRHPQYIGGILAIFVTTLLWYPHWLFGLLGVIGSVIIYLGSFKEDEHLIWQFGDKYIQYMQKVPRFNIISGIVRLQRHNR